ARAESLACVATGGGSGGAGIPVRATGQVARTALSFVQATTASTQGIHVQSCHRHGAGSRAAATATAATTGSAAAFSGGAHRDHAASPRNRRRRFGALRGAPAGRVGQASGECANLVSGTWRRG